MTEAPPVVQPPAPSVPPAPSGAAATTATPSRTPSDALALPSDPPSPQNPQTEARTATRAQPQPPGQEAAGQGGAGQEAAGQAEVERAEDNAGPRALAVVDLNTASVADLNRLRGGGTIGRAIVAKRPYASVDQLLTKRVLSRAVYERIKDQVTVR